MVTGVMKLTGKTITTATCSRLTTVLLVALMSTPIHSHTEGASAKFYIQGVTLYQQSKYVEAKKSLEKAVQLAPDVSSYHHWLGKAYGRIAENSGPFRAMSLSRRALENLETAVELDDGNIEAMKDLMEYYRQAPGFLGGNRQKAEDLARRIKALESGEISRQDDPQTESSS